MARCAGHPDRARRHDQPRGRCGPRHGYLLRLRLRRRSTMDDDKQDASRLPARPTTRATASPSTAPPATSTARPCPRWTPPSSGDFGRFMGWADSCAQAEGSHQRGQPRAMPSRPSTSARRASACAAPSICSSKPTASQAMREMIVLRRPWRQRKAALGQGCCRMQQGDFEAHVRGHGRRAR